MINDRELLELAAKASGFTLEWVSTDLIHDSGPRLRNNNPYWFNWPVWNPLDDDGDSLRMMVNLDMDVYCNKVWSQAEVCVGHECLFETIEPYAGDPLAATRRAIVRAAAEIGRMMK